MKHPVDVHVGKKVRHRRWIVGMTQQQLGQHVGIKFQQVQKYETGMNRISASRLWDISVALEVPVAHFFEGYAAAASDTDRALTEEVMSDRDAIDLIRSYFLIPEDQRARLSDLARLLSNAA